MVKHSRKPKTPARKSSKKNYKLKGGSNNDNINDLDISGIYADADDDDDIHEENNDDNVDFNFEDGMEDSLNTTRESINESINEPNIDNINPPVNYDSDSGDMETLHLSDLDTSNISSVNTTMEDNSFGGKKTKRKKSNKSKKRITRKSKKTKRKTRKNKTRKNKRGGNVDKLGDLDIHVIDEPRINLLPDLLIDDIEILE